MKQTLTSTSPVVYDDLWSLVGIVGAALLVAVLVLWVMAAQSRILPPVIVEPPAARHTLVSPLLNTADPQSIADVLPGR